MDYFINTEINNHYNALENPVVHVTNSVDIICKIIDNGFKASFSRERICDSTRCIELQFPMISFSDLPGDRVTSILNKYGHNAIGLKTTWAEKSNLSPVFYFEKNSLVTKNFIDGFELLKNVGQKEIIDCCQDNLIGEKHQYYKQLINIASVSKNYYNRLIRKGEIKVEKYCFGCEREWRFIYNSTDVPPFATKGEDVYKYQSSLSNFHLQFTLEDIEYFVVEAEFEEAKIKEKLIEKFNVKLDALSKIKFHYDVSRYCPDE
jgi:hypothetical protein